MNEGLIDFNHKHLQVPNMNGFLFIFNKQLIKRCTIVSQYDVECSFMHPVNFFISSFSTEHPNGRRIPEVRNNEGIIKQFAFWFINYLSYSGKALMFLFALRQSDLRCSSNFSCRLVEKEQLAPHQRMAIRKLHII